MHFLWALLAVGVAAATPLSTSQSNGVDVESLLWAGLLPTPDCGQLCLSDLVYAARELLFFKDTISKLSDLCRTYDNASLCVAEHEMACTHASSFAAHSQPILSMCSQKMAQLQPLVPCMEQHADDVLRACDSACLFTPAVSELSTRPAVQQMASQGGNRTALLGEMDTLCPAAGCFISCISRRIDENCMPAGADVAALLLRPFFVEAELIEADAIWKQQLLNTLPPSCYPFVSEEKLMEMQTGLFQNAAISTPLGLPKEDFIIFQRSMDAGNSAEPAGEGILQIRASKLIQQITKVEEQLDVSRLMKQAFGSGGLFPTTTISTDATTTSPYQPQFPSEGDLETLLAAAGVPSCDESCLSDLLQAAGHLLHFSADSLGDFDRLCEAYANASLCVSRQEVSCVHEASFVIGTSGIQELCEQRTEEMAAMDSCVAPLLDDVLSSCDALCHFTDAVGDLLDSAEVMQAADAGGDRLAVYKVMAPVCPTLGCFLSCGARSINRDCEPAGTQIAEALLRPFNLTLGMLQSQGADALQAAKAELPRECLFLLSQPALDQIAAGMWGIETTTTTTTTPSTTTTMTEENTTPTMPAYDDDEEEQRGPRRQFPPRRPAWRRFRPSNRLFIKGNRNN